MVNKAITQVMLTINGRDMLTKKLITTTPFIAESINIKPVTGLLAILKDLAVRLNGILKSY